MVTAPAYEWVLPVDFIVGFYCYLVLQTIFQATVPCEGKKVLKCIKRTSFSEFVLLLKITNGEKERNGHYSPF